MIVQLKVMDIAIVSQNSQIHYIRASVVILNFRSLVLAARVAQLPVIRKTSLILAENVNILQTI